MLHTAPEKCRTKKIVKNSPSGHHSTICRAISSQLRHVSTIGKKLLNSNISPSCCYNMVNFGLLDAEIVSSVWGSPGNFNGFRFLAELLHSILVLGVSDSLRCVVEQRAPPIFGRATITLGIGPHYSSYVIGQTIIFLPCGFFFLSSSSSFFPRLISAAADWMSTILPHMA